MPTVEWARVREFTIGTVERPETKKRRLAVRGPRAIRVPKGAGESKVFAPCAYIARARPPAPPSAMEPCLYEDPESQHLLCYLVAEESEDGERCHRVYDADGEEIGAIRRIPPSSKLFKHTWRIEQPGRTEIIGRNEWASGGATQVAVLATGKVVEEALGSLFGLAYDENSSSERRRDGRTLEWRSNGNPVMISQGVKKITIKPDWMDRRLAFAFAVIGDR